MSRKACLAILLSCVLSLLLPALSALAQSSEYDVLIRNGHVVDGTGNPWIAADVGITGDRIAFVGRAAPGVKAKRTIDAGGLVVAPGFIDMLGQSELALLIDPRAVSKLTQGITTEITGEGDSPAPMDAGGIEELRPFLEHYKLAVDWHSLGEYFDRLEKARPAINLGAYVGAARVRAAVLGPVDRAPTADQLKRMRTLVEEAMRDGAMGISTALIYAPGSYARTDELIALARVASQYGGVYASHIRNEADDEMAALDEAFRIGREARIPVEIFHLKVSGQKNWGKMRDVVAAIEQARASGVDVTADQYPYLAGATQLSASIPPKFHEGGSAALIRRLRDPAQREAIRKELANPTHEYDNLYVDAGDPEGVLVFSVLDPKLKKYEGKTVAQIAEMEHKDALDALMDLVIADRDSTSAAYFIMKEDDVRLAMRQPWVSTCLDANEAAPDGPLSDTLTHPRAYSSFPRVLGKYVREEHLMPLEEAIRKFTSLPAQRMRLDHRGLLRPGYFADVTIFDPNQVLDVATYENPNRTSVGIEYVFVNGVLSLEHGKVTGERGGRPLRGPGWRANWRR